MITPKAACGVLCPLFGVPENFNFWGGAEAGVAFMSQSDIWCEPLAEGVCQRSLRLVVHAVRCHQRLLTFDF